MNDSSGYTLNELYAYPDPHIVAEHLSKYEHHLAIDPNILIFARHKSIEKTYTRIY